MNPNDPFYHLEVPRARHFTREDVKPLVSRKMKHALWAAAFITLCVGVIYFNAWVQS